MCRKRSDFAGLKPSRDLLLARVYGYLWHCLGLAGALRPGIGEGAEVKMLGPVTNTTAARIAKVDIKFLR